MTRYAPLALLLGLAACQADRQNQTDTSIEQQQREAPVKDVETLPPDETAVVDTANGAAVLTPASTKIPERLHGRWGMVPADCTSTRGDAKGLMTVTADTLRFYESRATVAKVARAEPERFAGTFSFSGEGQEWTADVTLARNGDTLTRQEQGSSLTYTRCA